MSIIPPGLSRLLQFYLSGPMPCPYLPGQVERKLFTRLVNETDTNAEVNGMLTRAGFRRSHDIAYRPACAECNACTPVRIPVRLFTPSRTQKRIAARNRAFTFAPMPAEVTDEVFALFRAYQNTRHADSDMAHMTREDVAQMLADSTAGTRLYGLRDPAGALLGGIIVDPVGDGASAVYSFFAPDMPERSLGTQLVLSLIDLMRSENLPYVYLGYWIAASRKMAYKAKFQPLQALTPQGWELLVSPPPRGES